MLPLLRKYYHLTKPFLHLVAEGRVPGHSYVTVHGLNPSVASGESINDMYNYGTGEYPFSTTADIVSISSDNASDNQLTLIDGIGADGNHLTQYKQLNGQSTVAITPLRALNRFENLSSTDYQGNIYIYSGTTQTDGVPQAPSVIKGYIDGYKNQSQSCLYTIPLKHVGFLVKAQTGFGFVGTPGTGVHAVDFAFRVRSYGNVFKTKKEVQTVSTAGCEHIDERAIWDKLPALSEIKISSVNASINVRTWGDFQLLIVHEDYYNQSFLDSIAQPVEL